jgi:hypothetical protein
MSRRHTSQETYRLAYISLQHFDMRTAPGGENTRLIVICPAADAARSAREVVRLRRDPPAHRLQSCPVGEVGGDEWVSINRHRCDAGAAIGSHNASRHVALIDGKMRAFSSTMTSLV